MEDAKTVTGRNAIRMIQVVELLRQAAESGQRALDLWRQMIAPSKDEQHISWTGKALAVSEEFEIKSFETRLAAYTTGCNPALFGGLPDAST